MRTSTSTHRKKSNQKIKDLCPGNYKMLLKIVKDLSGLGSQIQRHSIVKMSVLLRLVYRFNTMQEQPRQS